jgi:hypothetical protein
MSYLGLKRDLKEGEYHVLSGLDKSYVAKIEKGKVTIAENRCKHRGFKVASCDGRGPIKCQYHGQRFEYERRINHHEFGEFLFSPDYLGTSQILSDISKQIGEEFGSHTQEVKAPFHLWMQNTADPNHLTTAHKDSFSKLFDGTRPENVYISEYESSYTMRIKDEVVERYGKHFELSSVSDFRHILGFPNLSVTSFLDVFFSVECATPTRDGCRVNTRFFVRSGINRNRLLERVALESNIKILKEDKDLVEKWALDYTYDPDTKWLPGEARIKRYADEIRSRGLE